MSLILLYLRCGLCLWELQLGEISLADSLSLTSQLSHSLSSHFRHTQVTHTHSHTHGLSLSTEVCKKDLCGTREKGVLNTLPGDK